MHFWEFVFYWLLALLVIAAFLEIFRINFNFAQALRAAHRIRAGKDDALLV